MSKVLRSIAALAVVAVNTAWTACERHAQATSSALDHTLSASSDSVLGTSRSTPFCGVVEQQPLRISPDSIGILSLTWDLRTIRHRCPLARDTVHYGEATESGGNIYPALVISSGGVIVIGIQWSEVPDSLRPLDVWTISGRNVVLPEGIPLDATWGQLHKHYGAGVAYLDYDVARVMFCKLPRLLIDLRGGGYHPGEDTPNGITKDLSRLPEAMVVDRVGILLHDDAGWRC